MSPELSIKLGFHIFLSLNLEWYSYNLLVIFSVPFILWIWPLNNRNNWIIGYLGLKIEIELKPRILNRFTPIGYSGWLQWLVTVAGYSGYLFSFFVYLFCFFILFTFSVYSFWLQWLVTVAALRNIHPELLWSESCPRFVKFRWDCVPYRLATRQGGNIFVCFFS